MEDRGVVFFFGERKRAHYLTADVLPPPPMLPLLPLLPLCSPKSFFFSLQNRRLPFCLKRLPRPPAQLRCPRPQKRSPPPRLLVPKRKSLARHRSLLPKFPRCQSSPTSPSYLNTCSPHRMPQQRQQLQPEAARTTAVPPQQRQPLPSLLPFSPLPSCSSLLSDSHSNNSPSPHNKSSNFSNSFSFNSRRSSRPCRPSFLSQLPLLTPLCLPLQPLNPTSRQVCLALFPRTPGSPSHSKGLQLPLPPASSLTTTV